MQNILHLGFQGSSQRTQEWHTGVGESQMQNLLHFVQDVRATLVVKPFYREWERRLTSINIINIITNSAVKDLYS
jgi:hypothetical protein